ncbi:hypothetical protein [Bifidobacterium cuniculi]|uniref:Uncharacterized protein n=1 Tax=Bifidobacterium cuniculi TaxID=1688 RepID=A0A087AHS6_9BIFI|nr:hypothetical protein [Bifidobacterium cuniculi]KFI58326.1 hypothetical protein BCUN_1927 [Bifidobacterium cuniculi]
MRKDTHDWLAATLDGMADYMHPMVHKLAHAIDTHQLANQATVIELEALCRIADSLEALVASLTEPAAPKTPTPKDVRNGRH